MFGDIWIVMSKLETRIRASLLTKPTFKDSFMSKPLQITPIFLSLLACCVTVGFAQTSVDLTVDQSQSSVTVSVLGGTDVTSITGEAVLELGSASEPFGTARVTDLNMSMADGFQHPAFGGNFGN